MTHRDILAKIDKLPVILYDLPNNLLLQQTKQCRRPARPNLVPPPSTIAEIALATVVRPNLSRKTRLPSITSSPLNGELRIFVVSPLNTSSWSY
jgi:hypothetical protein